MPTGIRFEAHENAAQLATSMVFSTNDVSRLLSCHHLQTWIPASFGSSSRSSYFLALDYFSSGKCFLALLDPYNIHTDSSVFWSSSFLLQAWLSTFSLNIRRLCTILLHTQIFSCGVLHASFSCPPYELKSSLRPIVGTWIIPIAMGCSAVVLVNYATPINLTHTL